MKNHALISLRKLILKCKKVNKGFLQFNNNEGYYDELAGAVISMRMEIKTIDARSGRKK